MMRMSRFAKPLEPFDIRAGQAAADIVTNAIRKVIPKHKVRMNTDQKPEKVKMGEGEHTYYEEKLTITITLTATENDENEREARKYR